MSAASKIHRSTILESGLFAAAAALSGRAVPAADRRKLVVAFEPDQAGGTGGSHGRFDTVPRQAFRDRR